MKTAPSHARRTTPAAPPSSGATPRAEQPPGTLGHDHGAMAPIGLSPRPVDDLDGEYLPALLVSKIQPSPTNPRKTFDEGQLAELAESIRAQGVLQPVVVRPGRDGRTYELVCGERRWRAARMVDLKVVPAVVRVLSDAQVREIQLVENLQRADVSPLEEVEGYRSLLDQHGYTAEQLAQRLGKSRSYVYGLLKLADLPPKALAAVRDGTLPLSTALLVARVPGADARAKLAEEVLAGDDWDDEPLSFRATKKAIETEYMVELKKAPFDRKALDLVPAAGSCVACPRRTGSQPDLYPGTRADVCTDPACYRIKVAAHAAAQLASAAGNGKKVLDQQQAAQLFHEYGPCDLRHDSGYVALDAACHEHQEARTYGALLVGCLADQVVLAVDREGRVRELVPRKAAVAELVRSGAVPKAVGRDGSGRDAAAVARDRKQAAQERARRLARLAEVRDAARRACALYVFDAGTKVLRELLRFAMERSWGSVRDLVYAQVLEGLSVNGKSVADRQAAFDGWADEQPGSVLMAVMAVVMAAQWEDGRVGGSAPLRQALGLDKAKAKGKR